MYNVLISSESLDGYHLQTFECGNGDILFLVKVTDSIGRKKREILYSRILKINQSNRIFCILDNSDEFENTLTLDDISYFDNLMMRSGITEFYGATITNDPAYGSVVNLANASANLTQLKVELISTATLEEAEAFIKSKL